MQVLANRRTAWRKKLKKWIPRILLLYLIYLLVGVLVVPALPKKNASPDAAQTMSFDTGEAKEKVLCIEDNEDALIWRLRMIASAEESITMATFDMRDDSSGHALMAALLDASERGVRVQLLVDGISGSLHLKRNSSFRALASASNVEIRLYNPINLLMPWRLNYCMHDKYLMIDDTAYLLGGRNSYDLFLGEQAASGNIDRDILVYEKEADEKSSFYQLRAYFTSVWESSCAKSLSPADSGKLRKARQAMLVDADALREKYPQAYEPFSYDELTMETDGVSLLSNPVQPGNKDPVLWEALCSWMQSGRDIRIQTPYMICDRSMYADLQEVCSTADVRIMTNAVENGANPFGCSDYLNQKSRILDTGASVDEWLGGRSLHSKMVLIDDSISIVGSFNIDMRSCYLDTELMLVIDCKELNQQLREDFGNMETKCRMVSPDGEMVLGSQCTDREMNGKEKAFYGFLKVVMRPFRYLL